MRILVTGGAGFVGSHTAYQLEQAGHEVTIFDNLSQGHRPAIGETRLIVGDVRDRDHVQQALADERIDAIIHFAGLIQVGESVQQPAPYYDHNVQGTLNVLEAMRCCAVNRLVFSSSAAVYGAPARVPIEEDEPLQPHSPYGETKRIAEAAARDWSAAYGIGFAALRYFNAAGAAMDGRLGEDHRPETHLIPVALDVALGKRSELMIYGDDFPTPDGTCVRDYIHVDDLARAHVLAVEALQPTDQLYLNIGLGRGFSVQEVVAACRRVTGHPIPTRITECRPGDPPQLVASATRAMSILNWKPRHTELEEIVASAWRWRSRNPRGYADR